jgi:predicted O-methyltransferase YrrM
MTGPVTITLDYPPTARNAPRYGYERPPHHRLAELLAAHEDAYRDAVATIARYADDLAAIAVHADDPREPSWVNGFLPGLDGAALYAFARDRAPRRYVEVGSGNSTRFVARGLRDGGARTELISIDPAPRAEIDELCDHVLRVPFEEADLGVFDTLRAGDMVFFDGSHRVFMNADTTVFFLDVLPRLAPGVLVGIHDIRLPDDYAIDFAERWYSEQYLLACWLLGGGAGMQVRLPAAYVTRHTRLAAPLDALWERPGLEAVERHGDAFWFETGPAARRGLRARLRG